MKKLTTILFVVGLFIATNISAQDVFVAKWDLMYDSLTTSIVGNVDAPAEILAGGLTVREYYTGSFGTAQRIWFNNGAEWPNETAPNFERYIELKISPKTGYNLTVDNVVYSFGCYGTRSYMFANTYWDTNPTFANKKMLDTSTAPLNDFRDSALVVHNYQINATVNDGGTFYLRIFPWYGTTGGTTKYIMISDVIITGSTSLAVGVDEEVLPSEFALEQNYPNPFNPTTEIQFAIPKEGNYSLKVFNLLGQEVSTLVNGQLNPGIHNVNFDAGKLTSGMYIYQLTGSNVNICKKMLLMK